MVRRLRPQSPMPLCLGPLNNYFRVNVLEHCRGNHLTARVLLKYGLPLQLGLRPWQERFLNNTCDLCTYVRLNDRRKGFLRERATFATSVMEAALRQRSSIAMARSAITKLEVVTNCEPLQECKRLLLQNMSMGNYKQVTLIGGDEEHDKAAVTSLANITGLSTTNAFMMYDQLRCSRCEHAVHANPNASQSSHSSFWEQIARLHNRFAAGIAY